MKGFSKSIACRFQPIWKIKNQMGKGKQLIEQPEQNVDLASDQLYEPFLNTEKCKKRSKKHKKRRREYQDFDY